jgi:hypothetical protein
VPYDGLTAGQMATAEPSAPHAHALCAPFYLTVSSNTHTQAASKHVRLLPVHSRTIDNTALRCNMACQLETSCRVSHKEGCWQAATLSTGVVSPYHT